MSIYARAAALLVIVLVLAGLSWKLQLAFDRAEQRGYDRRAREDKTAAEAQTTRMRELQRAAETRYTVSVQAQTKFLTKTAQEIHDASAPLAACPVPEPSRVRLNAARECARGDSPAACGAVDELPAAR